MDEDFDIDFIEDLDIEDILANTASHKESLFRFRFELEELDSLGIGSWEDE